MKKYEKPNIIKEIVKLEDIILISGESIVLDDKNAFSDVYVDERW